MHGSTRSVPTHTHTPTITPLTLCQLVDEIKILSGESLLAESASPSRRVPTALLFQDSESFRRHLSTRKDTILSCLSALFAKYPPASPDVAELERQLSELLAAQKQHVAHSQKMMTEKEQLSDRLDTATHRFNLSWLLNDHNADAYWGLGVVSYQKNNIPEAIRLLKKGLNVADTNVVLMDDLAALQIKNFQQKKDPIDLNESESLLLKIIALNPKSATSYQKLSVVNYLKADYEKSWEYFHQARGLDLTVLDLGFLNELLAKQPDPKGVFK